MPPHTDDMDKPATSWMRNIALVGFMGCGKSTVGWLLTRIMEWEFNDTDALIETDAGLPVAALFAQEGESAFRDRETRAICCACAGEKRVISTGGGGILRAENVAEMHRSCFVVWLTARPEIVVARTLRNAVARPILARGGDDPEARLAYVLRLLGERGPLYQRAAHAIVDTSDRSPESVAREVARRWAKASKEVSA